MKVLKKSKTPDFPYGEKEFTQPADKLIIIVEEYYTRLYGEKPTRKVTLAMCAKILETR